MRMLTAIWRIAGHQIAGLLAVITALAWMLGNTAAVEPVPSVPVTIKQPVKLMVCDRGGEAEIKLHREYITTIYVPFPVTRTLPANTTEEDQFTFWYHEEYLRVRPNANSVPGDHSSFDMRVGGKWVSVRVLVVDDPTQVDLRWDIAIAKSGVCGTQKALALLDKCKIELGDMARRLAEAQARVLRVTQELAEARHALDKLAKQHAQEHQTLASRKREQVLLDESIRGHRTVPIDNWVPAPGIVQVHTPRWELFDNLVLLRVELENTEPHTYPLTEIQLFGEHGTEQTGSIKIAGMKEEPVEKGQVLATLAPGARVPAAIWVRNPAMLGTHVSLVMRGPQNTKPVMQERIPVWDFRTPPHPNEGYTTLYVKALIGALTIGDKSAPEAQELTWIRGLGGRVTYGLLKNLDVEADLIYLESGEVTFTTAEGQMRRSAMSLRTQFGGLLYFGSGTYRPTLRLGAGIYGASVLREIGGNEDRSFDFALTLNGGLGLDVRLSDNARAGVALSVDNPLDTAQRSFEVGLYVGYGWPGADKR